MLRKATDQLFLTAVGRACYCGGDSQRTSPLPVEFICILADISEVSMLAVSSIIW